MPEFSDYSRNTHWTNESLWCFKAIVCRLASGFLSTQLTASVLPFLVQNFHFISKFLSNCNTVISNYWIIKRERERSKVIMHFILYNFYVLSFHLKIAPVKLTFYSFQHWAHKLKKLSKREKLKHNCFVGFNFNTIGNVANAITGCR